MKKFFNDKINLIKKIPLHVWIISIGFFVLQYGLYLLAKVIIMNTGGIGRCWSPCLPGDNSIPVIPIFVIPYVWAYVVWFFGGVSAYLTSKENFIDWCIGMIVLYLLVFIIFTAFPTVMDRSKDLAIQEAMQKKGFLYDFWRFIVASDGADYNLILFPGFHCALTMYCYFAVHKQKNISLAFKIYLLICVVLVSLSTIFTKQHYYIDIFGGLLLSIIIYIVVKLIKPGKRILDAKKQNLKLSSHK